ncbi:MAG TPA: hypothetical protein VGK78_09095 [Nocardioides sp.]|uniref:hypothetical protein n=1 Tax=Nocardioides sp. TaxID=35761 RepID=UPI002F3FFD75
MTLDVRSLREWVVDLFGRGRLSGGGPLGDPRPDIDMTAPPAPETDRVVSPDGIITDNQPGRHKA